MTATQAKLGGDGRGQVLPFPPARPSLPASSPTGVRPGAHAGPLASPHSAGGSASRARYGASSAQPHPSGAPYVYPGALPPSPRVVISVDHYYPGVGHFTRLISADGGSSVAELVEALAACFEWPQAGRDRPWSLRVKAGAFMRTYARDRHSIGTEVAAALQRGSLATLTLGGYSFFLSVCDVVGETAGDAAGGSGRDAAASTPPGTPSAGPSAAPDMPVGSAVSDAAGRARAAGASHAARTAPDASTAHLPFEARDTARDATRDAAGEDCAEFVLLTAEFLPDWDTPPAPVPQHPLGIPTTVDVSQVNFALAGEDALETILASVDPELRTLVRERDLVDFVPLLQALDLHRPAPVSEHAAELLADAPVERSLLGRAAAWSRIVALSALVDAASTDAATEAFMARLGFTQADAARVPGAARLAPGADPLDPLSAPQIRELARATTRLLALAGADTWEPRPGDTSIPLVPQCSIVERLEMYRFLLQK